MTTPETQPAERWFGPAARERLFARCGVAHRQLVTFVENNPLAAVGAATAVGFVFARMLRR
jgi:ElaB/YqjD/DUF883 family membrane-anchored ribosome-binding protein